MPDDRPEHPDLPKRDRGYYTDPADPTCKLRSVTAGIDVVGKAGLTYWAAEEVALEAIRQGDHLVGVAADPVRRAKAFDWLKGAPKRNMEARGKAGDAVHHLFEAHILGQPIPEETANNPDTVWALDLLRRFIDKYEVTPTAAEMVVANPDNGHAGRLDLMCESPLLVQEAIRLGMLPPDADLQLASVYDYKTGGAICRGDDWCYRSRPWKRRWRECPGVLHSYKGVYDTQAMQFAAYRQSTVAWVQQGGTVTKVPMPASHPIGWVLHLRPEGLLAHPVRCGPDEYAVFLHALAVDQWMNNGPARKVFGTPIPIHAELPAQSELPAPEGKAE